MGLKMRSIRFVFLLCSFFSLLFVFLGRAEALEVQVTSEDAHPGDSITVEIKVAHYAQEQIAAAAFTLSYSLEHLTLTAIESSFFDTFSNQWNSLTPPPSPLPPGSATVNNQTYTQPVLAQTTSGTPLGKSLLVGARVEAGTPETLFTLHFTVNPEAAPGIYPISISPSSIDNVDAGYAGTGTLIPILYDSIEGESDLTAAYPAYLPDIVNGAVNVQMPFIDSDNDGIYDAWEIEHFGDLGTANATSDADNDGYTDLQEYLNAFYPVETDPNGAVYDPTIENAPDGTGYNPVKNGSFWLMVLPAITGGGQQ